MFLSQSRLNRLFKTRDEPTLPLAQRSRVVRANVRNGVNGEPTVRAGRERLDKERERWEEAAWED